MSNPYPEYKRNTIAVPVQAETAQGQEPKVDLRTRWPMNNWPENKQQPKREWVGLTEEERDDLALLCGSHATVCAVEETLKAKNA